ncbi:MAG: ATP-binding protein [Acidimicrobiales bacterium]
MMARRAASSAGPRADDTARDRASGLRRRYVELRRSQRHAAPSPRGEEAALLDAFADLARDGFADWVAIDLVDASGTTVRARLVGADNDGDVASALERSLPGLAGVVDRVIASGETEIWSSESGAPRAVVVGLRVKDRAYGAVSYVLALGRTPYGRADLVAAEEAAWGLAAMVERRLLQDESRAALRATQRMARQLHQVFAATVSVSGARDELEVATTVVQSARRVFDADLATLELTSGLAAWTARGEARATLGRRDDVTLVTGEGEEARRVGDWLVVPVAERDTPRYGVLAVRREGRALSSEDLEIATLLAQAAATALGSRALARGIERSEARLRALVEAAPVGIVEASPDGTPRWWNRAAERIFAWPAPGEGTLPVVPRALALALGELATEVGERGGPAVRDLVDVEVRGRARDLTTAAARVELPGESDPTLMVLIDDVTDHRQLKAEVAHAQQMELRGQVASTVAHDFNNLITLIIGYAEILVRELDDERLVEMVRDIQLTASRAARLTAQLQSIGRAPALDPVALNPSDVVRAIAEVLERVVGGDVELELVLGDAGAIRVDAAQFEQMLLNLAMNARDAMPDGGRLTIAVDDVEVNAADAVGLGVEPGRFARVSVTDTGFGMDEDTMARCFDAFFTTKGPLQGTGLGLASARRLVEASGGVLTVRSGRAAGTTFEALFPVTREAVIVELANAVPRRARGFATILVAEDDDGLRRLMVQVLSRNGYQVLEGASGEEARALAGRYEGPIDLLVSDVVLGGVTGPELAAELQRTRPSLLVLLTSGTADASALTGLDARTSMFLAKPFRPSALIDGIQDLLARRG